MNVGYGEEFFLNTNEEYYPSFGKQNGLDRLEALGGDVGISQIKNDIHIESLSNTMSFTYFGLVLGFIEYKIVDCVASLEFIGNINMSQKDAEMYGVIHKGLESLENEYIKIEGLGEYMLAQFIEYIKDEYQEIEIITSEIDNPRIIELFTYLKCGKIISDCSESLEIDERGFPRKYLQTYL